jgi:predicted nucleic acid-binding protein
VGEVARGIALQRAKNPRFAEDLQAWLDALCLRYGDRILPFGTEQAALWGVLSARIGNDSADLMIAATALTHDLTVVTRNTRHYGATGARVLNPGG